MPRPKQYNKYEEAVYEHSLNGWSVRKIAEKFDIGKSTVHRIVKEWTEKNKSD